MPDGIGIYGGMAPMRPIPGLPEAPGREPRPEADTPGAHRRLGDSLAGCFPAEPAAASPGGSLAADRRISRQVRDIGVMPQKIHLVMGHPPKLSDEPVSDTFVCPNLCQLLRLSDHDRPPCVNDQASHSKRFFRFQSRAQVPSDCLGAPMSARWPCQSTPPASERSFKEMQSPTELGTENNPS